MGQFNGMPNAAHILTTTDGIASAFKAARAALGNNLPGDTTSASALADLTRKKILGDGSGTYPGIGHPTLEGRLQSPLTRLILSLSYGYLFGQGSRAVFDALQSEILSRKPDGWTIQTDVLGALNVRLLQANAMHVGVPTTPTSAPTLTAAYNAAGALPNFASGNCPYVYYTLVGTNDYDESLSSPASTQIALAGVNNTLSVQIGGTVPAGVKKARFYRGRIAEAAGNRRLLKEVGSLTVGSAFPAVLFTEPDIALRDDAPPQWASMLLTPEAAAAYAFANAAQQAGDLVANLPFLFSQMIEPQNVALGPSNGFLGEGNTAQTGQYASAVVTGAATATVTAGTIQTTNQATNRIQGFAGGIGVQARVTQALTAAGTVTINYTYFDSEHGWGNLQTQNTVLATFGGTGVDALATFVVPNDANGRPRIIQSVTIAAVSGFGGSGGAFVVESPPVRAY